MDEPTERMPREQPTIEALQAAVKAFRFPPTPAVAEDVRATLEQGSRSGADSRADRRRQDAGQLRRRNLRLGLLIAIVAIAVLAICALAVTHDWRRRLPVGELASQRTSLSTEANLDRLFLRSPSFDRLALRQAQGERIRA